MATQEQFQSMLTMMQQQMARLDALQQENDTLRRQNAETKLKKPDRPIIEGNWNDSEWALFLDTWRRYKIMASLTQADEIRMELRAACSSDVNKFLFEFVGPNILDNATEEQLLAHIKSVAVKGLHKEVHRVTFGKLKQGDGESVTHFVARLNAQAALCGFSVTCTCHEDVSFAEEMVAQQLVAGLRDQEHQSKVLSEANTLNSLQLKVQRLQSLETTEESATKLHVPDTPSSAAAAKSGYKKSNRGNKKAPGAAKAQEKKTPCGTCGRLDHYGRSMTFEDCPAARNGKKCYICGKEGHFSSMCKNKAKAAAGKQNDAVKQDTDDNEDEEATTASSAYFFATNSIADDLQHADFRLRPMST